MTISTNDQVVNKEKYEAGYTAAFGDKKPAKRGTFVYDPELKKMVPKTYRPPGESVNAPMVLGEISEFKSPIDGQIITSRKQLAAHNKKHDVTHASDYSPRYIERKATERVTAGQKYLDDTRRSDIGSAIDRFSH